MHLNHEILKRGLRVKTSRDYFDLIYPEDIWENFSEKSSFIDNVIYLNTFLMPLVSGIKELKYSTSMPFFKRFFNEMLIKDIPSTIEDYNISTKEMIDKFKRVAHIFTDKIIKKPDLNFKTDDRTVIPFSSGKDSLLSLGVCNEIRLRPVPVYINDCVSPSENKLKLNLIKRIGKLGFDIGIIKNNIETLNDFEYWGTNSGNIGYSHLMTSFCFLVLPFCKFYNARYIILGNELDLNFKFKNKDGISCYPSYNQSIDGTKRLNKAINDFTNNSVYVASVINPLHDLAIMKILHLRYPELGAYESSCSCLDVGNEKRWCYQCTDCMAIFTYMKAIDKDPKIIGFKRNLFNGRYFKYHALFNPKIRDRYDKAGNYDQMKFAYYLAYRNKAKGYVIDVFKKRYLNEVKHNEDRFYKKYFRVHNAELIPKKIRKKVISIYREELS